MTPTLSRALALLVLLTFTAACGEDDTSSDDPTSDMSSMSDASGMLDMSTNDQGSSPVDMTSLDMGVDQAPPLDMNTPAPFTGNVDPACIDGMYTEELPTQDDISPFIASYSSANARGFYEGILDERYPMGAKLVAEADATRFDCVEAFKGGATTADQALDRLGVVVHECGHFYDIDRSGFDGSHYAITPTLSFQCARGDTTSRGGETFERSRIAQDMFSVMRPACQQGRGCDFYSPVYLDGNPDDDMFEGGDQGYNSVLEEAVQYVNSLATGYAFRDTYTSSVSDRDGILTFLWYIGRYLHMARTQYPAAYAHLSQDACWRQATLTVWGRAWLFLEATRGEAMLGIEDDEIEMLVLDPVILNEIELLRNIEGCSP